MQSAAEITRELREMSGLSLRQFADRVGTSPAAVSNYEKGRKEPMLTTLMRMADAVDEDLVIEVRTRLTQRERRTLSFHRAIADKLRADPEGVRRKALENIAHMRKVHGDGRSKVYLDSWELLIHGDDHKLLEAMTGQSRKARALQHASPFAGVLSEKERLAIFEKERPKKVE